MKPNLQNVRKEAGFKSAKLFADHMGMSVNTYTALEQGRHALSLEQAWQFADALGEVMGRHVSIDEIAGRDWPRIAATLTDEQRELLQIHDGLDLERKGRLMDSARDMALAQGIGSASDAPEGVAM